MTSLLLAEVHASFAIFLSNLGIFFFVVVIFANVTESVCYLY